MLGFEIGRLGLPETLSRIESLKDISVFPLDEDGVVIHEDPSTHQSARELRLLLQHTLELSLQDFLVKMRELYFHLFAADHSHYSDLLFQAARKSPALVQDFCMNLILSEDVIFLDDQKNLLHLFDVLDSMGLATLPSASVDQIRGLLREPFFRRPSLHARVIQFLGPSLNAEDFQAIRALYEMDLVPLHVLPWDQVISWGTHLALRNEILAPPRPRPEVLSATIQPEDLEDLRWSVGLEGVPLQIVFRYLGALAAAGPEATQLFYQVSEALPDAVFHRRHFETEGHQWAFEASLNLLREDLLREVHRSGEWISEMSEEIFNPANVHTPLSAWPTRLRFLPTLWTEFANPIESSEIFPLLAPHIETLDGIIERLALLLTKSPLPSADALQEGETLAHDFLRSWQRLLAVLCPHLDVLP